MEWPRVRLIAFDDMDMPVSITKRPATQWVLASVESCPWASTRTVAAVFVPIPAHPGWMAADSWGHYFENAMNTVAHIYADREFAMEMNRGMGLPCP